MSDVLRRAAAGTLALIFLMAFSLPSRAGEKLEIEVDGLSGEMLVNVQASLKILQQRTSDLLAPQMIRELHDRAERDITRALEPFGYYRPTISAQLRQPNGADASWRASYTVDAGQQVPVVNVDIQFVGAGANDKKLPGHAEVQALEGEVVLDHRRYESAKTNLLKQLKEQGYLDATYTEHRVEVDLASYSASLLLHINTGPQYVFGPIVLEQLQFAPDYLEQYLVLRAGEPFSQTRISQQRTALSKSGHFQDVAVEPGEPSADNPTAIPLHIRLTPYKPNRYRGRLGWGTDTGFGVQGDWTRRYIGKRGHHYNLGITAVEERKRAAGDLRYLIPLDPIGGSKVELAIRHESKDLTFDDVDLDEGGETRIATNLAVANWHMPGRYMAGFDLESTVGLSLVEESYDVFEVLFGNLSSEGQAAIIGMIGPEAYKTLAPDFEAVVPGVQLTFKRSDNPLYIRRGDYINLDVHGADESLGSNVSFVQLRLDTWNIWSIGDSSRFLLRTSLGYTKADSNTVLSVNFNQMPEYYEFRAGGARSVRGYAYETLFPSDAITGGKHLLVGSVEYEYEIIPNWSVAAFLDGGNAFNDFDNIDEKLGAGIGVRWRSPVGLARIDLGIPLDDADESFQVYITIGPEF